jgi:copper/silver efflux system protein
LIARWIDLCARNSFLVFTGTLLLVLAGVWAERRMPLDALPDISDVQVIIHTAWNEPPNVIEDQVTYPIVTALLAAPSVKAVRRHCRHALRLERAERDLRRQEEAR